MAEKIFYSMGEVAEMFDVKTSLIRHWEAQFSILQPKRNKKGNRLFTPEDVENLKVIYHLVKERGMTLEGAKRAMKRRAAGGDGEIRREAELMTRLRHIRALLVEVREDLKTGGEGIVDDEKEAAEVPASETPTPRRRKKAVVKLDPEAAAEPAEAAPETPETPAAETPHSAEPDRADEPFAAPLPDEEPATLDEVPAAEAETVVEEMPIPEEEPALPEPQIVEEMPAGPEAPDWDNEPATIEEMPAEPEPEAPFAEAEPDVEEMPIPDEEPMTEAEPAVIEEAPIVEETPESQGGEPKPRGRRGRRKSDDDDKELFAFYEQSLF